jgi:hypothetical protein
MLSSAQISDESGTRRRDCSVTKLQQPHFIDRFLVNWPKIKTLQKGGILATGSLEGKFEPWSFGLIP